MSPTSRPPALRVPVMDVVSRASLVTPVPPRGTGSEPPAVSVVQRPVRIISDPPPPVQLNPPSPLPAGSNTPSEPTVTIESGTPPQGAGMSTHNRFFDEQAHEDGQSWEQAANLARAKAEQDAASLEYDAYSVQGVSTEERHALIDDSGMRETEAARRAGEIADLGDLERDGDSPLPPGNAAFDSESEGYASMEVEQLELSDELADEAAAESEEDGEENEIDVSMPPPAPPEALRAARDPLFDDEEESRRPSGEFEELDVDPEERPEALNGRAAPPPPPVGRISADPPDLAALARNARVQDIRPTRPRPHAWWEVFFDDDYLRTVRPPTREQIARQCDFIEKRLGLRPGATLLDVGCGLGLHVLELASRGYLGVGLDLSLPMLSRASEEAQSRSLRVNFLHSDMREMSFDGSFDAVLCMGTTLGYFDEETNRRIIERLYRALKPGGVLLLDLVNRDHVIRSQPNLIWFEGDGCVCMEESEFNFFTSRLHVKRTVILDSGRQTENEYSLRMYSLHELGQLLNGIGFRVREVSGRDALPGVFFGQESPNLVIVAERRKDEASE
jgi:SAM-dependent methyltransferase